MFNVAFEKEATKHIETEKMSPLDSKNLDA